MDRSRLVVAVASVGSALFVSSVSPAQPAPPPLNRSAGELKTAPVATPLPSPKADAPLFVAPVKGFPVEGRGPVGSVQNVAVVALTSNAQCEIQVMLKNQGLALPESVATVPYSLKRGGVPIELSQNVPAAQLRAAGSTAVITVPVWKTAEAAQSYTARSGTAGAAVTNSLRCGPTGPALVLDVTYEPNCSKKLVVQNTGGDLGSQPNNSTFAIARERDGWNYRALSTKNGIPRGGTLVMFDERSYEASKYSIVYWGTNTPVSTVAEPVPPQCRGAKPNFQVGLADVGVNSGCYPTVTILNQGAPLPRDLMFPVDFVREGVTGTTDFESGAMGMPTGERREIAARQKLSAAFANFKITLRPPSGPIGPKVISLNCPSAR